MTKNRHALSLAVAITLGAILRFWNLDLKPLWMDEVITAVFSLGQEYNNLPLDVVLPIEGLHQIFTYQPGKSCSQIAQILASQSTHPPLFFCLMYSWLGWINSLGENWVMKLRSLPALFGVGTIAAIYFVNRLAFSKTAGLIAAMLMAVSPFAVYLSQEARHYTLPMLLITLSLLELLIIQKDVFKSQKFRLGIWVIWTITNIIGIYVHYFFILALISEIATLSILLFSHRVIIKNKHQIWLALILSISAIILSFLPWLPVIVSDYHRPETNWLDSPSLFAPFYQILIGWVMMVVAFPVENQPLPIVAISGFLMLVFVIWLSWLVYKGFKQLWSHPKHHLATLTLLSFTGWVLLEFFAIAYLLGKDITAIFRYNFVYYPSFCALVAASLTKISKKLLLTILLVGFISSTFVIYNLFFLKPFEPTKVSRTINQETSIPLMVVVGYRDYQDVALGLSFGLALEQLRSKTIPEEELEISANFAFFQQSPNFQSVWQKLSQLPPATTSNINLWVIAPGMKRREYPQQVAFSDTTTCTIDAKKHYRIGVPYQLYRCGNTISR